MFRTNRAMVAALLLGMGIAPGQSWDSLRGAAVLRKRGCSSCHAILGRGGGSASDLTSNSIGVSSPAAFAAELWNHAPEMWAEMARKGAEPTALSTQDTRDIFGFLYSVRYFEPSGDIERGRRVYTAKQCHRCHALVRLEDEGIGPAAPDWPTLTDPVAFLEAMWNHGKAMGEETSLDGIRWPTFTPKELADLLAYVYNLPDRPPRLGSVQLGSASGGMRLFGDLGCVQCHSILETDPDLVALAPATAGGRTITELAIAMWNHQPVMEEWAKESGRQIPALEGGQMGQILSYLMEEGYLDRTGNEKRGARLFRSRGCEGCHDDAGWILPRRTWSAADLVAAVWKHGPAMRQQMVAEGKPWPTLSEADMRDIISWLNVR